MIKYYYAGGQRVAMRVGSNAPSFLLGDHLGSTSLTTNSARTLNTSQRYYPWGSTRAGSSPTAYQFTGQRNDYYIKLYHMGARMYDPELGRFISPDSIVPSPANPQSLNRYSYVLNSPLRYTDPSGQFEHETEDGGVGELYDLLGFEDEQSYWAWWNSLPPEWQKWLHDAQWGSELTFTWDPGPLLLGDRRVDLFGPMKMSMMFVSTLDNKLAFFSQGHSMGFFAGEGIWLEAFQQTGDIGELTPITSQEHPWWASAKSAEMIGDSYGEVICFQDALFTNKDSLLPLEYGSWVIPLLKWPNRAVSQALKVLPSPDPDKPYVYPSVEMWHQFMLARYATPVVSPARGY